MPEAVDKAVLVLDVESFGPRTNPTQVSVREAMYAVVRHAFADAGLEWPRDDVLDRGDGLIVLADASADRLAGPFVQALNRRLVEHAGQAGAEQRMRLRVALHRGLCHPDPTGWAGAAINTACRMVDAGPLRQVLKATTATSSRMVFIVSDEIFQGVVRHDYDQIESAAYGPVRLDVKEVHAQAWVYVPGCSYPPGLPATPEPPPATRPASEGDSGGGFTFHGAVTVNGDQIGRDKIVHGGPS